MPTSRRRALSSLLFALLLAGSPAARAITLEGIVYESEAISEPKSAWILNRGTPDHWTLWTQEQDIDKKRSGGAVLVSPPVKEDRKTPEEGAPPLHSVVRDLKPGVYLVFVSPPQRPLGYSLDGKHWFKHSGGELALGPRRINGPFELWVDDRYAALPGNPGGAYYDYIRFVPAPESALEESAAPQFQFVETWSPQPGSVDICWTTSRIAPTGVVEYGTASGAMARTPLDDHQGRNHRVHLSGLDPVKEYRARIVLEQFGQDVASPPVTFRAAPPVPAATRAQRIPLLVPEPTQHARSAWPATVGMPFAKGALADVHDLRLSNPAGQAVPLQAELLSRWPDGSVQWCVLSFLANTRGGEPAAYQLECSPAAQANTAAGDLAILKEATDAWTLRAGPVGIELPKRAGLLRCGEAPATVLRLERADGQALTAGPPDADGAVLESNGPVRAVLRWSGRLVDTSGKESWRYIARLTTWKGLNVLGLDLCVLDDEPTPKFVAVKSLELVVPFAGRQMRGVIDDAEPLPLSGKEPVALLQDKEQHAELHRAGRTAEVPHAGGWAQAYDDHARVTAFVPDFWQTYPKGFAIAADALRVGLLPALRPDTYSDAASQKVYHRLFAWFDKGNYLFRAGQLTRNQVYLRYDAPSTANERPSLSEWLSRPLLPQAPPEYLCGTGVLGRKIFAAKPGKWDEYETFFASLFKNSLHQRDLDGTYGWMHYGDWFGERGMNYGNNEYDMAWTLAVQWMRCGNRDYFDRGLQMARHYSSVDTVHGPFSDAMNGLCYEHSYDHLGTERSPEEVGFAAAGTRAQQYLLEYANSMFRGAIDRQGHVFQEGNWIYACLAGDRFIWDVAQRVSTNQATKLTPNYNFEIERAGGWPLINAAAAYRHTGNPFYLNAARLMIERTLKRQDAATGGWLHKPPLNETDGVECLGGKAFAVGILSDGILRYLEQEPQPRPDVRHMLLRGADWLMNESWIPGKGFRYISNCPKYATTGGRGATCLLVNEMVAFAYQETKEPKYRNFWQELISTELRRRTIGGIGKDFSQCLRQTVFGLDRALEWGQAAMSESGK